MEHQEAKEGERNEHFKAKLEDHEPQEESNKVLGQRGSSGICPVNMVI